MAAGAIPITKGGVKGTIGTPMTVLIPARVIRVRLTGMLFDTDKCFLLPSAMKSIRAFRKIWNAHPDVQALIVGHADTAGAADHNQKLSERRAEALKAYLEDDVDAWLAFYSPGVAPTKLWGTTEDQKMLTHLGFASVLDYQTARSLAADGVAGPDTRRSLVTDYMNEDGTRIPATAHIELHGCGESHPEIPTADGVAEQRNRRVEIFLFEEKIDPPPQNPCPQPGGCDQHADWTKASSETVDLGDDFGSVTVSVTDQAAAPVPAVDVHLSGIVPEDAQTGAAGTAAIAEVIPARYEVFARKQGFESASTSIQVPPGADTPVALVLKAAAGNLEVLVRDAANTFLPGATVSITGPQADTKTTDGAGKATFFPAPAGAYQIAVTATGFKDGAATDTVNPDQTTTVVVTLARRAEIKGGRFEQADPAGTDTLEVRLLDEHDAPCPATEATVLAGDARVFGTSDANGVVKVTVPADAKEVVVRYTPPGSVTFVERTITVELGPVTDDASAIARLVNLGYPADKDLGFAVYSFQRDFGVVPATLLLDAATRNALAKIHDA